MLCLLRRARIAASPLPAAAAAVSSPRLFHRSSLILQKPMPSRPKPPPDSELEESYLKGSGPGGQKINKTNSAVQIKHIPTGIVVKSQGTRSRSQNRKLAREILAQRLDDMRNGAESRAGIVGAVRKKRADSAAKKSRRKYKKLGEERAAAAAADGAEGGEDQGVQRTEAERAETERVDGVSADASGDGIERSRQRSTERSVHGRGALPQPSSDASSSQSTDTTTR